MDKGRAAAELCGCVGCIAGQVCNLLEGASLVCGGGTCGMCAACAAAGDAAAGVVPPLLLLSTPPCEGGRGIRSDGA